jgi:hypothetical protein
MDEYSKETEAKLWYHNLDPNGQAHIKNEYVIINGRGWDQSEWIEFLIKKKKEADNAEVW